MLFCCNGGSEGLVQGPGKARVKGTQKDQLSSLLFGQGNGPLLGAAAGLTAARGAYNEFHGSALARARLLPMGRLIDKVQGLQPVVYFGR